MFQFVSTKQTESLNNSSKISQLMIFPEYNEVKVYGILRNLFGEPLYETEDYENAYGYIIKATEEFRNITLYFSVYQGPSGCAIGASERTMDMIQAVTEFMQLLKSTKPIDYRYEGIYMDASVRIKFGIQNGQVIYEECDLEEEDDGNEEVTESNSATNMVMKEGKSSKILRSLTQGEREELARFKVAKEENSFQVLLAMIVVDLLSDQITDRPITIVDLKKYCYILNPEFRGYPIIDELISDWVKKIFINNNLPLNQINIKKIFNLTYNFTDTLCNISFGMLGKYQREMLRVFNEINEELKEQKGCEMLDLAEESYQYIMWCLEYMGVHRQPSVGTKIVDMSTVTDLDYCEI